MMYKGTAGALTLIASLLIAIAGARAFDDSNYPDLKGQWKRMPIPGIVGTPSFDPARKFGVDQQAPLTPEYQKIYEDNLVEQAAGGAGIGRTYLCIPAGMPMIMQAYEPMEIFIAAGTTHIMIQNDGTHRRVFTDGRDWPAEVEPAYLGYSIGKWMDTTGSGKLETLEVETRHLRGPRVFDVTGIPLHEDNQTVIKERIYLDRADRNILHDEITVIDHALTRPWTADKRYRRDPNPRPTWDELVCNEDNPHVLIGKEDYMLSADRQLMPTKKNQAPPDLKYFKQARP